MVKNCKQCGIEFEITGEDLKFYEKVSVTSPTFCPDCRLQRRLSFRNENSLHKRKCSLCGESGIFVFPEGTSHPVYCVDCWWSDKWDPLSYGRDFDFGRPFFEQFDELSRTVPRMGLYQMSNENSKYNSFLAYCKNVYMSAGSYFVEDSVFCRKSQYSKDCLNCNLVDHSELLEGAINSSYCYGCRAIFNCRNCSSSMYLADCVGCTDCFMCGGVIRRSHCVKNVQYTKEEYEKLVEEKLSSGHEALMKEFVEFNKTLPKKYQNQLNCENSSGDFLQNSKNASMCFDCFKVEDSKYLFECESVKDCMDLTTHDKNIQLSYEMSCGGEDSYMAKFGFCACDTVNSEYLFESFFVNECFGCVGLHPKTKNCILNKQYSKEEYDALRARIVEHMKKTGEYGEFFPTTISSFAYNETVANDHFPLSQEEVLKNGWKWKDIDAKLFVKSDFVLPDRIEETASSVVDEILSCSCCGKNYKIIPMEFDLAKKMKVPLSKKCSNCRQKDLRVFKSARKLYARTCSKCLGEILSVYSPDSPEVVYCESCWQHAN